MKGIQVLLVLWVSKVKGVFKESKESELFLDL